jgi:hypothetical protein
MPVKRAKSWKKPDMPTQYQDPLFLWFGSGSYPIPQTRRRLLRVANVLLSEFIMDEVEMEASLFSGFPPVKLFVTKKLLGHWRVQ